MATILKAGNVATGAQITSDATGILEVRTGTGAGTTAITVGTNQAVTMGAVSSSSLTVNSNNISAVNSLGFRNRIINGDMRIDQRNAGLSVNSAAGGPFGVDRWRGYGSGGGVFTLQQSITVPNNRFRNSTILTVTTADTSIASTDFYAFNQDIEGFNTADLAFGTADAETVTLSFWVRSSVTGTYAVALYNNGGTRGYPATYTISSANTWTFISLTIPGDTGGTWVTNNGVGITVRYDLGTGSNGNGTANTWNTSGTFAASRTSSTVNWISTLNATFYITGVQLEAGSVATPFERRDYGRELIMAQRYYYRQTPTGTAYYGVGFNDSTTVASLFINFPVSLRAAPSSVEQSGTASHYRVQYTGNITNCSAVPQLNFADVWGAMVLFTVASGLTAGQASIGRSNSTSGYLGFSAEL
jgi:hypothetical protein